MTSNSEVIHLAENRPNRQLASLLIFSRIRNEKRARIQDFASSLADLSVLIGSSMSNLAILRQAGSGCCCCCSRFQSQDLGTLHRSAICQIDSGFSNELPGYPPKPPWGRNAVRGIVDLDWWVCLCLGVFPLCFGLRSNSRNPRQTASHLTTHDSSTSHKPGR